MHNSFFPCLFAELAWIPDLDLDLTGFTTSSALEMSERYIDRNMEEVMEEPVPVIEEDHMEEPVPVIEEEGMIEPVPVITTTEHPEEVEYGPPREQGKLFFFLTGKNGMI